MDESQRFGRSVSVAVGSIATAVWSFFFESVVYQSLCTALSVYGWSLLFILSIYVVVLKGEHLNDKQKQSSRRAFRRGGTRQSRNGGSKPHQMRLQILLFISLHLLSDACVSNELQAKCQKKSTSQAYSSAPSLIGINEAFSIPSPFLLFEKINSTSFVVKERAAHQLALPPQSSSLVLSP